MCRVRSGWICTQAFKGAAWLAEGIHLGCSGLAVIGRSVTDSRKKTTMGCSIGRQGILDLSWLLNAYRLRESIFTSCLPSIGWCMESLQKQKVVGEPSKKASFYNIGRKPNLERNL